MAQLPWVQITNDLIDYAAPEMAIELDGDDLRLLGGLARMIRWVLGRVPKDSLPSLHDVIRGQKAAHALAKAAGWTGDPEAFVDAGTNVAHPIFERVQGGIRVRGMKRYDAAWKKNNRRGHGLDTEDDDGGPGGSRPGGEREPGGNRSDPAPIPDRKTETETERKTEKKKKDPPPPTPSATNPGAPDAPAGSEGTTDTLAQLVEVTDPRTGKIRTDVRWSPTDDGAWAMIQLIRVHFFGLEPELEKPPGLLDWFRQWYPRQGPVAMESTVWRYLADRTIRAKGHPTAVLITDAMYEALAVAPETYSPEVAAAALDRDRA